MREVLELVNRVACSDCCVLIEGESGTGKELIARRLCDKSVRRDHPFIPVNCAGISETLFESQFFGHVRGAFTGAEQSMLGVVRTADGGTVFLDEVCDIPLRLQPKLLRVLQEQEVMPVGKPIPVKVDTRFLAGTNRNLAEMVRQGTFRRDLYHRLNIVRIVLPPLRDRVEDCRAAGPFLAAVCRSLSPGAHRRERGVPQLVGRRILGRATSAIVAWIERLYVTGMPPEVLVEMLLGEVHLGVKPLSAGSTSLQQVERQAIVQALERSTSISGRRPGCCKFIGPRCAQAEEAPAGVAGFCGCPGTER